MKKSRFFGTNKKNEPNYIFKAIFFVYTVLVKAYI